MQKITIINRKKYTVSHMFNMVGNWYFIDKNNLAHLVDGIDVQQWAEEQGKKWQGIETAIAYAKELAQENDGVFWWKTKQLT